MASAATTSHPDEQSDRFHGLSGQGLIDTLESMSHRVVEGSYMRPLTEEELGKRKNNLVDNSVTLNEVAEEKAAATAGFNATTKRLNKANRGLLTEIREKAVQEYGKVFDILSDDDRWVDSYNSNGVWLRRRRAGPEDSQRHISNMRAV